MPNAAASPSLANRHQLETDGYTVVRGVVEPDRIGRLREACFNLYQENLGPGRGEIFPTRVLSTPEIAGVIFGDRVVAELLAILEGPFVVLPSFHVKGNTYVGWHTDHAFRKLSRTDPKIEFLQCAIYLQPAKPWGGLEVLPKTHFGPSAQEHFENLAKKVVDVDVTRLPPGKAVEHMAGDLVLWDARLGHRSSSRAEDAAETPKFGIHWTVGRGEAADGEVMERLRSRTANYVDGRLVENERFTDMKRVAYPEAFPEDVRRMIQKYGLRIAA
jgi:hypothetical protein